jgi:hypothetical protein
VPVTQGEKVFRARSLNSGEIDSTGGSIVSDPETNQSFLTPPKSTRSNDESLTYSEDSDTTRIYNLNTRETKLVVPENETVESPLESPVKVGLQFFRGSPKKVNEIRKMDDEVTTVIRTSNVNLLNGAQDSVSFIEIFIRFFDFPVSSIFTKNFHQFPFPGTPHRARNLRRKTSYRTGCGRKPSISEETR